MPPAQPSRAPSVASSSEAVISPSNEQGDVDNTPGLEYVGAANRGITRDRVIRWTLGIAITLFLTVSAVSGRLVQTDIWASWIWWLLAAVIVLPILVGLVRRRPFLKILLGFGMSLVAAIILFIVLLMVIGIGWSDDWFAAMVGNETMGTLGWVQGFNSLNWIWLFWFIGWLIIVIVILLLLIAAPLLLFGLIDVLSFDEDFSIPAVLILSILSGVACVFAIGQSIIINSGF